MAEKNNVATNGNNLEPEFDALLKAHVQQRANVAVCAQFDPDSATAYLEQAMSRAALSTFEAHLASCTVCRRHLIELSRLMPAPVAVAEPIDARMTFKDRLGEWFSGWRLGAMAGLGAVAATLLLVAVVVNRNASSEVALTTVAKRADLQATPLPEPSSTNYSSVTLSAEEKVTPSSSPAPLLMSKDEAKNAPAEAAAANAQLQVTKDALAAAPPPPPPAPTPAPNKAETERKEADMPLPAAGAAPKQSANFRAQVPSGPDANQMQAERALEQRKREAQAPQETTDSTAPASAKPAAKSVEPAKERIVEKSKPVRADDAEKKSSTAKTAPRPASTVLMDRAARPTRVVSGKTFRQENGMWVDDDYATNRNLPVVRLTRDSDEYKQTLKDTPALKPYFDLKPVVVVWQGKVYRVENK